MTGPFERIVPAKSLEKYSYYCYHLIISKEYIKQLDISLSDMIILPLWIPSGKLRSMGKYFFLDINTLFIGSTALWQVLITFNNGMAFCWLA